MTAKLKAEELVNHFNPYVGYKYNAAKQCALIVVEIVLNETGCGNCKEVDSHYWKQVKTEIENL